MTLSNTITPTISTNLNKNFSATSEIANNWLLPDGVHDVLFEDANKQQYLRHHLLKGLQLKGFDLVTPPLIEYTESLIGNASESLKRQTFKMIDQITGRLMGLRADITPQISRIDANYGGEGISRYCYAGHTVHTLPSGLFGLRASLQLGAEIFGTDSMRADFELLDIICDLFSAFNLNVDTHFNLGHVGIFKRLTELAKLPEENIAQLMQLYKNKALPELQAFCKNLPMGNDFFAMAKYGHNTEVLSKHLSPAVSHDSIISDAIKELNQLYVYLTKQSLDNMNVSIDVTELAGYYYHSGLMFNMYLNGGSQPLLRGGRFDGSKHSPQNDVRPAIGFSMDVTRLLPYIDLPTSPLVLVNFADLESFTDEPINKRSFDEIVSNLRCSGYRVVIPLTADDKPTQVTHTMSLQETEISKISTADQLTEKHSEQALENNNKQSKNTQKANKKHKKNRKKQKNVQVDNTVHVAKSPKQYQWVLNKI